MTSPSDPVRTACETELRDALIAFISDRFWRERWQAAEHVDALCAGPLADLIAAREEREHFRERTGDLFSQLMLAEKSASDLRIRLQEAERAQGERLAVLEVMLGECINQLEYQHEKFGGTGSGDTVIYRARAVLHAEARSLLPSDPITSDTGGRS
jgi:hypothetical protein